MVVLVFICELKTIPCTFLPKKTIWSPAGNFDNPPLGVINTLYGTKNTK